MKAACTNAFRVLPGKDERHPYFTNRPDSVLPLELLVATNLVICSSSVVERSVLEKCGGFPEGAEFKAIEDYALWLRVASLTPFAYCSQPLVEYTDDPANSVRTDDVAEQEQRERIFRNVCEWAESEHVPARSVLKRSYRKALRKNGKFWKSLGV